MYDITAVTVDISVAVCIATPRRLPPLQPLTSMSLNAPSASSNVLTT